MGCSWLNTLNKNSVKRKIRVEYCQFVLCKIDLKTMKKIYFTLFILCLLCVGCSKTKSLEKWTKREAWNKLEEGMTEQQVIELLGKPKQKIRRSVMMWYYQESPREMSTEPDYGFVKFQNRGSHSDPEWYVLDWKEPYWDRLREREEKTDID